MDYGKRHADRGIDRDLFDALYYHMENLAWSGEAPDLQAKDIAQVFAVWTGELTPHSEDWYTWYWIVRTSEQWALLEAYHDYTGWSCQMSIEAHFGASAMEVLEYIFAPKVNEGMADEYMLEAYYSLRQQLADGKAQTWTEARDIEFDLLK